MSDGADFSFLVEDETGAAGEEPYAFQALLAADEREHAVAGFDAAPVRFGPRLLLPHKQRPSLPKVMHDQKDGKYIFGVMKVRDKGQVVIPKDVRKIYDIKRGDALILLGDQRGLGILKTEIFQSAIDQAIRSILEWNKRWNKIEK